jgi:hypothetical protein
MSFEELALDVISPAVHALWVRAPDSGAEPTEEFR